MGMDTIKTMVMAGNMKETHNMEIPCIENMKTAVQSMKMVIAEMEIAEIEKLAITA
jgi:hypothetical protein